MKEKARKKDQGRRWIARNAQGTQRWVESGNNKYHNSKRRSPERSHRLSSPTAGNDSPNMPKHAKVSPPNHHAELSSNRHIVEEPSQIVVQSPEHSRHTTDHCTPPSSPKSAKAGRDADLTLLPIPHCTSEPEVVALLNAPDRPPVNKDSLEELEIGPVQTNITLRVDINYDHELHFTPIRGSKGEQRKHEGKQYGLSLKAELKIRYQHGPISSCAGCQRDSSNTVQKFFKPRLRTMFEDLKALLVVLIPDRDQYELHQYLDIPLLMQEATHGLLDITNLASWLAGLLTTHCAPIRDLSAHKMSDLVRKGVEGGDIHSLVAGIQELFLILESMKLDIANHQIRTFRLLLIEDTVAFQQEFFRPRFKRGTKESKSCQQWYRTNFETHQKECSNDSQTPQSMPLAALIHGLLAICRSTVDLKPPQTFNYDHKRLKEICVDIQDFIHVEIALATFEELVRGIKSATSFCVVEIKNVELQPILRNRILDLTDGDPEDGRHTWTHYAEAISLELVQTAHQIHPNAPHVMSAEQIAAVTRSLTSSFEHEHRSQQYREQVDKTIELRAHFHAKRFQKLTTLQISQEQKEWQLTRARQSPRRLLPNLEDISRRLAHIIAVHWRVWAELVYQDEEEDEDGDLHFGSYTDDEICEPMSLGGPSAYVSNTLRH
jgi:hypothetical protein